MSQKTINMIFTERWAQNYFFSKESGSELAKLTGTLEYTDCISAEEQDPSNVCSRYDTKRSDGEVK